LLDDYNLLFPAGFAFFHGNLAAAESLALAAALIFRFFLLPALKGMGKSLPPPPPKRADNLPVSFPMLVW